MPKKYDLSKKSDMRKFEKDMKKNFNETLKEQMFKDFCNSNENLTYEQRQNAKRQIDSNVNKGLTSFEVRV